KGRNRCAGMGEARHCGYTVPLMPTSEVKKALAAARESLSRRMSFEEFLAKLPPKDRVSAERRVTALETESIPQRTDLGRRKSWRRSGLARSAHSIWSNRRRRPAAGNRGRSDARPDRHVPPTHSIATSDTSSSKRLTPDQAINSSMTWLTRLFGALGRSV